MSAKQAGKSVSENTQYKIKFLWKNMRFIGQTIDYKHWFSVRHIHSEKFFLTFLRLFYWITATQNFIQDYGKYTGETFIRVLIKLFLIHCVCFDFIF